MRRFWPFWCAFWLLCLVSGAALPQMLQGIVAGGSPYVGPINIVASPNVLYSLRAGSAAIATTGTQSIVDLRRTSDNATCTATIAASGGALDLTVKTPCNSNTQTVTAWTNNASSVTGTIATTVFNVTACSACNLAVGLPITGAGVTAGTVITSLGTGTGGIGTYSINISQTESVSETMTAPGYAFISKWYDQSVNGKDVVQATAGNQPKLVFSGPVGVLPSVYFGGGASEGLAATVSSIPQPISFSAVVERVAVASFPQIIGVNASDTGPQLDYRNSANTVGIYAGTLQTTTASDQAPHSIQAVVNGASSSITVDGAGTGSVNAGAGVGATTLGLGGGAGNAALKGYIWEAPMYPVAFSASNITAITANQRAYFGF